MRSTLSFYTQIRNIHCRIELKLELFLNHKRLFISVYFKITLKCVILASCPVNILLVSTVLQDLKVTVLLQTNSATHLKLENEYTSQGKKTSRQKQKMIRK